MDRQSKEGWSWPRSEAEGSWVSSQTLELTSPPSSPFSSPHMCNHLHPSPCVLILFFVNYGVCDWGDAES